MENLTEVLKDYKKQLEQKGYNVLYIGLYGSQNYNLSDKNSDVDVKVIVGLNLEDLINRKIISKVIDFPTGQANVQDILTFQDTTRKGNPACLEAIYSKYWIGSKELKEYFKQFKINHRAVVGMSCQKYAALEHKYPSKIKEIEKWGFDPKQLHHIVRLYDLLNKVVNEGYDKPFYEYSDSEKNKMIELKRNSKNMTLAQAQAMAKEFLEKTKQLVSKSYKFNSIETSKQKKFITDFLKKSLKEELLSKPKKQLEIIK